MAATPKATGSVGAAAAETGKRSLKWRPARTQARAGLARAGRGVRSRRPAAATGRGVGADCSHGGCAGGRGAREGEGNPGCGGVRRGARSTGGRRLRTRPLELGDPGREHVSLASLQSNRSPPPIPRHFYLNCHDLSDPN
eukprot:bmy_15069T0